MAVGGLDAVAGAEEAPIASQNQVAAAKAAKASADTMNNAHNEFVGGTNYTDSITYYARASQLAPPIR